MDKYGYEFTLEEIKKQKEKTRDSEDIIKSKQEKNEQRDSRRDKSRLPETGKSDS